MNSLLHAPHRNRERLPLVGRREELERLRSFFAAGERLVTLLGPPGIGKTRLAFHHAAEEASFDPAAVVCVDLSEARTAADLAERLLASLGLPPDDIGPEQRLGDALRSRGPLLLVLDNCEYLEPEARQLVDGALALAPLLRVLATSQVRLGIEGEVCFDLPPLAPADAVALYEAEARRCDPHVRLERAAVEELTERLDRNALAWGTRSTSTGGARRAARRRT